MVEEIAAENGSFLAISYEMSLGKEVSDEDWNESLYEKWGEFLGKIHHATKGYHLRSGGDTSPPKFVVPPDYFTGKQECGIEVGENYNLAKVRGCEATE